MRPVFLHHGCAMQTGEEASQSPHSSLLLMPCCFTTNLANLRKARSSHLPGTSIASHSGRAHDICTEYIQPIVAQLLISAQARGARRTRSAEPQARRHPPRRPPSTHLAPAITSGTCAFASSDPGARDSAEPPPPAHPQIQNTVQKKTFGQNLSKLTVKTLAPKPLTISINHRS